MKEDMDKKKTIGLKTANDFQVLGHIATSWGLLLIMVVAPLCWGLLPIGYDTLNGNEAIKANPLFTVFMRMFTSFILTALCAFCIWLWFGFCDMNNERRKAFHKLCRLTKDTAKSRVVWLVFLFVCYFGARALEMNFILTYSLDETKIKDTVSEIQKNNSYLGEAPQKDNSNQGEMSQTDNSNLGETSTASNDSDKWGVIMKRTTVALKAYGYFMGLMLALLLAIKNNILYGTLSKFLQKRFPAFARNLTQLQGGKMTLVGIIFWASTLFLTIASGILYISAQEPLYIWPYILEMTGFACLVALLTSLGTDCKILGNVNVGNVFKDCPSWQIALVASITMNLFQAGGTALIALAFWFLTRSTDIGFFQLAAQYVDGKNCFMLIIVIGLLGSVIAPLAQLSGVNLHNAKLKSNGMMRYGVSGSEWLMICGGFEPLFVVLIGIIVPQCRKAVINMCPMFIAVLTVLVIALLKIAEVWSQKHSVIRNAIFAKVRGSTQDKHEGETVDQLWVRAMKLSFLKFYDKRRELSKYAVSLTKPCLIDELKLPLDMFPEVYLAYIVNGQHFFTQDDPFTNDVLRSHELYLKHRFPDIELISLKRFLVNGKQINASKWENEVRPAVRQWATKKFNIVGDDTMPYVLIPKGNANVDECTRNWADLLDEISNAVKSDEIDKYINGMIVQMVIENTTPDEFFRKYSVGCPTKKAAKYRNPQTMALRAFAEAEGQQLVTDCGINGAEYFIGGSLGYDALLKGNFDIDLRLLVPDDGKTDAQVHQEIDDVQKMLVDKAHANNEIVTCRFIDENGTNYIQHTKQIVKLPGTDQDVELTWNIQAKSSYWSIARLSACLPQIVRDRFVVAKGLAKAESKEAYDVLKIHWRDFIDWLYDKGAKEMDRPSLEKLLTSGVERFPLFLKAK